jgi:ABC-type uncharacterized transport system substrate-binding protein
MWCSAVGCIVMLTLSLLTAPLAAHAQPAGKLPRIGVLATGSPPGEPGRGAQRFRQALRDLGYVEGQTITLEMRWAENHPERWPDLAADLVRLPVDIIVAGEPAAALAAKHATRTIPIVMAVSFDPVRDGLVASLAQPGGNITGLSSSFCTSLQPSFCTSLQRRSSCLNQPSPSSSRPRAAPAAAAPAGGRGAEAPRAGGTA